MKKKLLALVLACAMALGLARLRRLQGGDACRK